MWDRFYRGTLEDRDRAIAEYERHVAEVKAKVPPEKLLVFSVDRGWQPLCHFLGVPVPSTPFPKANDRLTMRKLMDVAAGVLHTALIVVAAFAALAIYAVLDWIGT